MALCNVLIADDSADIRLLIRLALHLEPDLEIVGEATNGADAVAMADQLQPHLLLLDLSMPVMDGLEAIPLIREVAPGARVIVVSGFLNGEIQQRVLEAGASGFVEKGNDLGELVRLVREVRSQLD